MCAPRSTVTAFGTRSSCCAGFRVSVSWFFCATRVCPVTRFSYGVALGISHSNNRFGMSVVLCHSGLGDSILHHKMGLKVTPRSCSLSAQKGGRGQSVHLQIGVTNQSLCHCLVSIFHPWHPWCPACCSALICHPYSSDRWSSVDLIMSFSRSLDLTLLILGAFST
jgi:hypothetical protein